MNLYRKLYEKLFGVLTDAVNLLEAGEAERAKELLHKARREAEEFYVENADSAKAE